MTNFSLYDQNILPVGFKFPEKYTVLMSENFEEDIEPWRFLRRSDDITLSHYASMCEKYVNKKLIPFAIAVDLSGYYNDGYVVLACFDGDDPSGNSKIYFHDYGPPIKEIDWSKRYSLDGFDAWLEFARAESAHYKEERAEDE